MAIRKAALHWSGGKDAALAYHLQKAAGGVDIVALITTLNSQNAASTVHEIPLALLEQQAWSMGLPLIIADLPDSSLQGYEAALAARLPLLTAMGIDTFVFGDLQASGMLEHRRQQWAGYGFQVAAPLWALGDSHAVMSAFLGSGIKAVTVMLMADKLDESFLGRTVDAAFVAELPAEVDPCGEGGEYHTLVYNAPFFNTPLRCHLEAARTSRQDIRLSDGMLRTYHYLYAPARLSNQ